MMLDLLKTGRRRGREYCTGTITKCWGVLDDSPKVTESFSSFPLLTSSSWHPPRSQRFFYFHGIFLRVPWGAAVCGGTMSECWLRCFMWRWTLFSSVICCSHTLEGHLNAGGQRSCNTLGGEITIVARSRGILFCMLREQSILKWCKWDTQQIFFRSKGMSSVALTLSCRYHLVKECVSGDPVPLQSLNS